MIRSTTAALLLGLAVPVFAQEPSPSPTVKRDETVDVEAELPALPPSSTAATRLPVAVLDLPMDVAVVPQSLTRDQQAFVLSDALRNVSGVNASAGFGVFDVFTVRGFDSLAAGLVLTDGVLEPESTFYPLYDVRQVEVLKGPGSFLHGGNALAGAVQLTRKQPAGRRFADVSATWGSFGTFAGLLDANTATDDGRLAFRLNATWQGTDSYREVGDGSLKAIHPMVRWRPNDRTRVTASFELLNSEYPPDAGLPFVGTELAPVPRERSYQSPLDASTQDVVRARLLAERDLGRFTLRNRLYFTSLKWDSDGTLFGGVTPFPDGNTYVIRTLVRLDDEQTLFGNQLELSGTFETGSVTHDVLVGFEARRLADEFVQDVALVSPIDLFNPVEAPMTGTPVTIPAFGLAGDGRSLVLAPYAVDRLSFGPRVQLFAGARLDSVDYEDASTGTDRKDTQVSPLAGLVFKPASRVALHVSGGTSFAPPSSQVRGPREPETGRQLEAGAKVEFLEGRAFLGASVYHLERENIAIPDATGVFRQSGDQRSRGFEVDFSARPTRGLSTYASYAYTDAELTSFTEFFLTQQGAFLLDHSGNRPAWVPKHLLNVWLSHEMKNGFGVAGGLRAASEQFAGEDNRFSVGSYAVFDAAVSYRRGRARVAIHGKNLTGTDYETRGLGGQSAVPGRPFECLARLDIRLGDR